MRVVFEESDTSVYDTNHTGYFTAGADESLGIIGETMREGEILYIPEGSVTLCRGLGETVVEVGDLGAQLLVLLHESL